MICYSHQSRTNSWQTAQLHTSNLTDLPLRDTELQLGSLKAQVEVIKANIKKSRQNERASKDSLLFSV